MIQNDFKYSVLLKTLFVIFLTSCGGEGSFPNSLSNQLQNQTVSNLARPPESSLAASSLYQGVIIVDTVGLQGEASSSQYRAKSPFLELEKERVINANTP